MSLEGDDTGSTFTADEEAFFSSGGEKPLASESGSDNTGDAGGDNSGNTGKAPDADKDGDKGGDKAPKMVSLSALQEERTARKAARDEARKLALENAELKGKFSILERLGKPAGEGELEAPKGPPKAEEDIFGAVESATERLARLEKAREDDVAAEKVKTEHTTFVNSYKSDAAAFEKGNADKPGVPDYKQAYNFLLESRAAELQAIGYDTPQALHEALTADEMAIAQMAFSKGKSPAEMIYALANQRGYKKAAGDGKGDAAKADTGKGAEKLDQIARGQAANKSLSDTGGSSGDADMTLQRLIDMPMDEFEKWTEANPAKARRLMGG